MTQALEGLTALVTGASQSIGRDSALLLARDGATVVIMGRGENSLTQARDELRRQAPDARIEMFVGDATDEASVKDALAFAHGLNNRLDILVPTVGGAVMQPFLMRDIESMRQEFEVNYLSALILIRYGVPLMQHGGSIVCISSVAVTQSLFGMGLYGASKAALERMVRALAFELGGAGIRLNAVRPGMTVEPEVAADPEQAAAHAPYVQATPLGRLGVPDDIAKVVRFLAGPESGWVTGQSFSVDGGQEQGGVPDMMDVIYGKDVMDRIRAGHPVEHDESMPFLASTSLSPSKG